MKYVYISGPYSNGSQSEHVRNAIMAGDEVMAMGLIPFVPHLYHLWDMLIPHGYSQWISQDIAWLRKCDCMLILPGYSPGVQIEIEEADEIGIPIFRSIEELQVAVMAERKCQD